MKKQRKTTQPEPAAPGPRVQLHNEIEGQRIAHGWEFFLDSEDEKGFFFPACFDLQRAAQVAALIEKVYQTGRERGKIAGRGEERSKFAHVASVLLSPLIVAIKEVSDR